MSNEPTNIVRIDGKDRRPWSVASRETLLQAAIAEIAERGYEHARLVDIAARADMTVGVVTGTGRFTLEPLDGGNRTRFTWAEELIFPWWLGGSIGSFVGGKVVMRAIWKRNLRKLQQIVEAPEVK